MAERVETIRLTAQVQNYLVGMQQAQKATAATATASQKLAQQGQAMTTLGHTLLAFGTVVAAGVGLAIKTFADFDAQMSQVQALSHATAGDMTELATAAETLGQKIGISASQAADAEIELVKAGVSVSDILGGALKGSLELAAAGQIDVADATSIATIALTQFGLAGEDIPHVADLLAAGADKALGGVSDLGEALKSGGLVASQFGVSLDETIGTLSAFANAGLIGETAGTDLRQMLLKLADPSAEASSTMKQLGINIYDTSGKFVGISGLAGQLQEQLGSLSNEQRNTALSTIFGSRAIAGANVLYKEGAAGISKWTDEVNDTGFAARQAAGKMNNLEGDVSKLSAAFQNDLIQAGSSANDMLRDLVQTLTGVVRGFASLPDPVKGAILPIGALVAILALAGGAFLTLVPKIVATRAAMVELSITAPRLTGALSGVSSLLAGPWGVAIAGALLGVKALGDYLDSLQASSQEITSALTGATSATEIFATATKGQDVKFLADVNGQLKDLNNVLDQAAAQENPLNRFTGSQYFGAIDTLKKVGTQLALISSTNAPAAAASFNILAKETDGSKKKLWELLSAMPDYRQELINETLANGTYSESMTDAKKKTVLLAAAQDIGKSAAEGNADALAEISGKAQSATTDIASLADQIKGFASGTLDARAAERDFQQAVDDATKSMKDNGKTLDINTDAGRANQASLDDIAQKAIAAASAIYTQTGSQEDATKALQDGRAALIAQLAQYGITGDAANAYADDLGLIPLSISTVIDLQTHEAEKRDC